MTARSTALLPTVLLIVLMAGAGAADPRHDAAASGGETTVFDSSVEAFGLPLANLPDEDLRRFAYGNRLFKTRWVEAPASVETLDGLGPLYNRASCSACHLRDGRGRPPESAGEPLASMLMKLGLPGKDRVGATVAHPRYGLQIQGKANRGLRPEATVTVRYTETEGSFADGETFRLRRPSYTVDDPAYGKLGRKTRRSVVVAPALHGVGLLEAIPEETILSRVDELDRDSDGISGRANRVWSRELGRKVLGRFGWKAAMPSVTEQNAVALNRDMGITSSLYPLENTARRQELDRAARSGGNPEIRNTDLDALTFYTRSLAVPARRNAKDPTVRRGESLFLRIGCAGCHVPEMKTGEHPEIPALSEQTIRPYSDLLLHDMGPGLADDRAEFGASGSEWRTPPLWGIGLVEVVNGHTFFLHDGRARNLAEAILWHGGEAQTHREAFRNLAREDRAALIAFLESL